MPVDRLLAQAPARPFCASQTGTEAAHADGRRRSNMQTPPSTGQIQYTEGEGKQPSHTHSARTHTHDHFHISHHHTGNPLNQWEHRAYWHTHDHNHNVLTHSHDYSQEQEEAAHDKES